MGLSNGVLTFRITGQLAHAEFTAALKKVVDLIRQQGKVRLLVLVEDFTGIEKTEAWGDVSFQAQNDKFIEKIAIVGKKKYEDLALVFAGKGVRQVPIEFFPAADRGQARDWLVT
jgi:hypothetical protein